MITIQLTTEQFLYLRAAVKRDLDTLNDMEPWEIDDQVDEWKADIQLCKGMSRLLAKAEQEQVVPH